MKRSADDESTSEGVGLETRQREASFESAASSSTGISRSSKRVRFCEASSTDADGDTPTARMRGGPKGIDPDFYTSGKMEELRAQKRYRAKSGGILDETGSDLAAQEDYDNNTLTLDPNDNDGIPIEPFNMKAEMNEGRFDESGHYIWRDANIGAKDNWLYAVDKGAKDVTFDSTDIMAKILEQSSAGDEMTVDVDVKGCIQELIQILQPAETPLKALKRIKTSAGSNGNVSSVFCIRKNKKGSSKAVKGESNKDEEGLEARNKTEVPIVPTDDAKQAAEAPPAEEGKGHQTPSSVVDQTPGDGPEAPAAGTDQQQKTGAINGDEHVPANRLAKDEEDAGGILLVKPVKKRNDSSRMSETQVIEFNRITELCDILMSEGKNVYFETREQIEHMLEEGATATPEWMISWEFRWTGKTKTKEGAQVHGPISSTEMLSWITQGHINSENPVEVRMVTQKDGPIDGVWKNFKDVDFFSYMQNEYEALERETRGEPATANGNDVDDDSDDEISTGATKDEVVMARLNIC